MIALRSVLFLIGFYGWTAIFTICGLPFMLGPRLWTVRGQWIWAAGVMRLLRHLCGITYQVEGWEHLPQGACIVASKHQSAWETIVFNLLVVDPAMVYKKELSRIPFYGWYALRSHQIPIDRKGGANAMRVMLRAADRAVAHNRPIIIFPEGTRTTPGEAGAYHPGVAGLYRHLDVPAVPVAVDSGLYWGKNTFIKRPGTIRLRFLATIPPGLSRKQFLETLEQRIETASRQLLADAKQRFGETVEKPQ